MSVTSRRSFSHIGLPVTGLDAAVTFHTEKPTSSAGAYC